MWSSWHQHHIIVIFHQNCCTFISKIVPDIPSQIVHITRYMYTELLGSQSWLVRIQLSTIGWSIFQNSSNVYAHIFCLFLYPVCLKLGMTLHLFMHCAVRTSLTSHMWLLIINPTARGGCDLWPVLRPSGLGAGSACRQAIHQIQSKFWREFETKSLKCLIIYIEL